MCKLLASLFPLHTTLFRVTEPGSPKVRMSQMKSGSAGGSCLVPNDHYKPCDVWEPGGRLGQDRGRLFSPAAHLPTLRGPERWAGLGGPVQDPAVEN